MCKGGNNYEFIGQIDTHESSTGWHTARLNVPQDLRGTNAQVKFIMTDYPPETDPTVYLTNINSVPEPSTMTFLGSGLMGLAGYGWKKFFKK